MIKYTVPAEQQPLLKEYLEALGIRTANQFPDLEHLAQDLNEYDYGNRDG